MLKRHDEKLALISRYDIRNYNNHSCVQRFSCVKRKEIGTVVCYKGVVLFADGRHKFPVFRTTETEVVDMMCDMTRPNSKFS